MKGQKVFRFSKRVYIYLALIAAAVAAVAFILIFRGNNGQISLYYSPSQNGAIILNDGENTGKIVSGKSISCVRYNSDSTACAVLMSDGATYSLHTVKGGKSRKLADNCTSEIVISYKGSRVVYLDASDTLYRDKAVIDESVKSFAVSPDASAVIYVKSQEDGDKLYLYIKGKSTAVGDGYTPVAVSSDGEYIYVLTGDNSFCILSPDGTMKSKLCSDMVSDSFLFSEDFSAVVFSDGDYTYMSAEGKSRVRLVPGVAKPSVPDTQELRLDSAGNSRIVGSALTDVFYSSENGNGTSALFYVHEDGTRTDIAASAKKFTVTDDDMLTYLDAQGRIYAYNGKESELVISGAGDFQATSKNRYIYYMTSAGEVHSVKGSNNQLIANGAYRFYLNSDDLLYIIMTDRKLYSVNGARRSDVIAENVSFCDGNGNFFCYAADFNSDTGTYDMYITDNGKKFTLAAEDVVR